jgi:Tfp pilus assembly protein PilO
MKKKAYSLREKLFVLAGILAVVYFVYIYFLEPFSEKQGEVKRELKANLEILTRYKQMVAEKSELESTIQETEDQLKELDERLLSGPESALAASELQKLLREIAAKVGIEIQREIPSKKTEDIKMYVRVPVNIQFTTDVNKLIQFLYEVEDHPKLLKIAEMQIQVRDEIMAKFIFVDLTIAGITKKTLS